MAEAGATGPGVVDKGPDPPVLTIAGRSYVLLPEVEFERLRKEAQDHRGDASPFRGRSIGPDLRQRRQDARLTLSEVAARAGIRLETLSRIENGRTNPTVGTVQAIFRALEMDVRS
jgi:DNA-binding XRE family transcriptional regulator